MSGFARRVAGLTGVAEERLERIAGGDLSEILLVPRPDGSAVVAKGGAAVATEAAMLRALLGAGIPAPRVEAEYDRVLILERIVNDAVFSPAAWSSIGSALRKLHVIGDEHYGWPVNYRLGTVELDNRQRRGWPTWWGEQRLLNTAAVLDRPWRERVERLVATLADRLPVDPPAAWLHGDLWSGNILVSGGQLAALIDPACYFGHCEVDLAMLSLFDTPPPEFWEAYSTEPGWEDRRPIYQLFPALVHLRLFGATYAGMVDRLLKAAGA
ncbi:MAG: Fructosamine-3-kinase [Alphaproteobacteria bacterium]|nr:Fructosamine-3-kinase [Alphaproteobacteria bacterium]